LGAVLIRGIGVDSVQISRLAQWLDQGPLLARFFHPREYEEAKSRGKGVLRSLAARFAAKEAFGKALGRGLSGLKLREIWVENDPQGKPFFQMEGQSAQLFQDSGGGMLHLSITHDGDMALAFVVWEV